MEDVPYASAVCSIMYAMVGSRPDLAYAVGLVSRYMGRPGKEHWSAVKWIMRYIRGAAGYGLTFTKCSDFLVRGFCDSDYAVDQDNSRSISGFVFSVGGNTVSWRSCLQRVVALSTTEAEYISLSEASREAVWFKGICEDLGFDQEAAEIHCDSQSAIYLSKNHMFHERTKHMKLKYNFIREVVADGQVRVLKVHTSKNAADVLTKTLPGEKFREHIKTLKVLKA
ncbi:secreted RxLR effector protein 161-like [Brassica napus]|uniref:secreted RxLR effector protein 161-like n=1 Tax=Brassica napus TaxID=3708 RepID=UPI0020787CE5|nr:secreted RxLR effector protein 161-like [Brassica napus]